MDLWNWDEASPQEVPLGNRLSRLEGAELGFYFPEVALQGDMPTEDTCWKATFLCLAGLPGPDWSSESPHPETPRGTEHASQAPPWSGDWAQLGCTDWDAWSRVSPALGPALFAGSLGVADQNRRAWGLELPHLLGLGAAHGLHQLFQGVPAFRSHHFLRTEAAVGPCNSGSLPQN
uniref:ETS variant transcription factor 2 n=1 Tax=Molossus molossus TaxID=27622 RepID=A0A7J8C788_MOLMO|nr:ETS variant transcription factor 2 [Molossus molossus]